MDAARWRRARALFEECLVLPSAQWSAHLIAAIPDDAALRDEVLALLHADAHTGVPTGFAAQAPDLVHAAGEEEDRHLAAELVGRRIGAYSLLREIGRGGMGHVWLAERADGEFTRQVAIKLIRAGWDDEELRARFRAERQILASLTHPNIAHLVDGGVTDDGKSWLALEYVDGVNLSDYCDRHRLSLRDRLNLFLTVCDAVSYAHARLVVHRDLKPSNLLVDTTGQVKLLDFGIAKLIDSDAASSGTRVFTPEYAAPEQVRGEAVTTSVDVYALGLLLYELLSGQRPYHVANSTPAAYERAILDQEPTRPSSVARNADTAARIAEQRHLTPPLLARALRGDLDAVVLKALRKEPAQRYASVGDFAADVRRYLDHHPVLARRGNWRYRSGRFLRRHALAATLGSVAALGLVGGLGVALWQGQVARTQRDRAETEAETARRTAAFLQGVFENADPDRRPGEAVTAQQLLVEGEREIRTELVGQTAVRAALLETLGRAYLALDDEATATPLLKEAVEARVPGDDRNAEAIARVGYARGLLSLKRYDECEAELTRARALPIRGTRDGDEAYAAATDMLGNLRLNTHKHDPAIALLREALELRRGLYADPDDDRILGTLIKLTFVLAWDDRADEAFALVDPYWQRMAAVTQPGDMKRRRLLNAEIEVLRLLNRNAEAVPLAREDFAMKEKIFGRDHGNYRIGLNRLATTLYRANRAAEALPLIEEVLARTRGVNEKRELADFAFMLRDYGRILDAVGRSEEAIAPLMEAAQRRRAGEEKSPAYLANVLVSLARAERRAGHFDAAIAHLDEGVALQLDASDDIWETTSLRLERTRLTMDRDGANADCAGAESAEATRRADHDANALAEAQAVVMGCWLARGDRARAQTFLAGVTAAGVAKGGTATEMEAIEMALAKWAGESASTRGR